MIVQANRSIERLDRRARPTSRSLNYLQRKAKAKLKLSPRLPSSIGVVWDVRITTSQRAATKAPFRPRETSAPPSCCIPFATQCSGEKPAHTFHLEGIVCAQWESGRWVAAPQDSVLSTFVDSSSELTLVILQLA